MTSGQNVKWAVSRLQIQSKVLAIEAATRNAMHSEQLNRGNLAAQRWSLVLLVLNFIGAVVYVVAASRSWAIPQERGLHSQTAEPFIVRRQWRSGYLWLLTALIWLVALSD
jgi:Ca2+/Na+ antiporter